MKKNFYHKIGVAELLAEVLKRPDDAERGKWLLMLALDLEGDEAKSCKTTLGKELITRTKKGRKKATESGKIGAKKRWEKQHENKDLDSDPINKNSDPIASSRSSSSNRIRKPKTLNPIVVSVIEKLNQLSGKSYKTNAKATVTIIEARISEGFSMYDLHTVVENQCHAWLGTEQQQYLRPETLFQPKKIEGYLNNTPFIAEEKKCEGIKKLEAISGRSYVARKDSGRQPNEIDITPQVRPELVRPAYDDGAMD